MFLNYIAVVVESGRSITLEYAIRQIVNGNKNYTYVFKGEWENASQLTKLDIIKGNLCHKRIVHAKAWEGTVKQLFD